MSPNSYLNSPKRKSLVHAPIPKLHNNLKLNLKILDLCISQEYQGNQFSQIVKLKSNFS